jgi:hypothetical protein
MAQFRPVGRREGLGNGEKPAIWQHGQALQPAIGWRIVQARRRRDIGARPIQPAIGANAMPPFKGHQPGTIGQSRQRLGIGVEAARQGPPSLIAQGAVAERL